VVALIWAALATLAALALAGWGVARLVTSPGITDPTVTVPRYVGAVLAIAAAAVVIVRYARLWRAVAADRDMVRARHTMRVDMLQVFLLVVLAVVLFPLVWILSMSLDPRDFSRPTGLTIIPPGATLRAYVKVLTQPSANPVSFARLLMNSLLVAGGTAALAVVIGTSAAYAFSRL